MTIEEIIRANRPKVKDNTVRTYKSLINNFAKQMGIKIESPCDVITNSTAIVNHIKDASANIRKTKLSAMIVFIEKAEGAECAMKLFNDAMQSSMVERDKDKDEQKMSEKQKKAMLPWGDVLKKYKELEKKVEPLLEQDDLNKEQFALFQMYVILSCNILLEPRRSMDWTDFKLRNATDKDNYLKVEKRKPFLVFNSFKTAKDIGQQIIPCPKKLYKILMGEWMLKNKHDYLLMNKTQTNKINSTQYMKLLYDFFGSNVSTNILRHSYLKHQYDKVPSLKQMKKTAYAMGQSSITQALEYAVK